ncbi:MAG: gliding motility protein [Deltaproteobacteria bacterium]|nr:gliding motility protein [Deltaproteobacteria bacterium]
MAVYNLKKREISCKIVFYGPARCGKTTSFRHIAETYKELLSGEIVSINTESDQTLFFDFVPMDLGKIEGFNVRVQLYTVPGHVLYKSTRKLVLRGVDGVVFVADSLAVRRDENILSLKDLEKNLKNLDKNILEIPLVLQYNKRDLDGQVTPLMPIEEMEKDLNGGLKAPSFPGSALDGHDVGQALKACLKLMWPHLKEELKGLLNE